MGKHRWLMIACCLLPIAAILLVRYMGWNIGGWSTLLILLCPLSHLLMMLGMKHEGNKSEIGHESHSTGTAPEQVKE